MTARDIVVISLEPWDDVWRRNQYLVDQILGRDPLARVVFVEPAHDPVHAALHGRRLHRGRGMRQRPDYGGRLWTFQPTKWLPRVWGDAVQRRLEDSTVEQVTRLGWDDPVLWINDPRWHGIMRTGWRSVYDVTDDWTQARRSPRESQRLREGDARIRARADRVVVCSPALQRTMGGVLVRNGVDVARYRTPAPRPQDFPEGPVAVYLGTLHDDRLDLTLVERLGRALDAHGGTVMLVGPDALTAEQSSRLRQCPGVVLTGPRHRDQVPAYLQHAHALVVPHVVTAFTDSLDPLKLYEYLAVGRPVISTPVAGFRDHPPAPGLLVVEPEHFPSAVVTALGSWAPAVTHAEIPTWEQRGAEFVAVLDTASGARP